VALVSLFNYAQNWAKIFPLWNGLCPLYEMFTEEWLELPLVLHLRYGILQKIVVGTYDSDTKPSKLLFTFGDRLARTERAAYFGHTHNTRTGAWVSREEN
jgi:hypothetical protein